MDMPPFREGSSLSMILCNLSTPELHSPTGLAGAVLHHKYDTGDSLQKQGSFVGRIPLDALLVA